MTAPLKPQPAATVQTVELALQVNVPSEKKERAILPAFAAEPLTFFEKTLITRWRRGEDTQTIGDALRMKESDIYNRLYRARSIEHARIAAGVEA